MTPADIKSYQNGAVFVRVPFVWSEGTSARLPLVAFKEGRDGVGRWADWIGTLSREEAIQKLAEADRLYRWIVDER